MAENDNWIYQGRQQHGWFGHGTAPDTAGTDEDGPSGLFARLNADQRVAWAANSLIGHVPRKDRSSAAATFDGARMERLKATIAVWYASGDLSRGAFRAKFLTPYTGDATVDQLRDAAKGMVEAEDYEELNAAGADLAGAVQTIGLSASPRYLGEANRRATDAVADGSVPAVVKVAVTDAGVGFAGIVLGGLLLGGYLAYRGVKPPGAASPPTPTLLPPVIVEVKPDPVPVPEPKTGETIEDVLKPSGKLVGQEGKGDRVRELPGGAAGAQDLFDRLKPGGTETPDSIPERRRVVFPNGDSIQYRPESTSGPPTIDVTKPGLGIRKLKFP